MTGVELVRAMTELPDFLPVRRASRRASPADPIGKTQR
jgi:hypothetical protein